MWTPAVRSDVATANIDGDMVIFDPTSSLVHQLNAVGSVVWQLLDGTATVAALVTELSEWFEVPVQQVRRDVHDLLDMMAEHGLLAEVSDSPTPTVPTEHHADKPAYLVDPPAP